MILTETIHLDSILEHARIALTTRSLQMIAVVLGTLISLALLNLVAPRLQLIDLPDNDRKQHRDPIPLTGGFAILCGVFFGTFAHNETDVTAANILALLAIVATVHAFDDQSGLSARQRLVIDAVIALAFIVITGNVIETLGSVGGEIIFLGLLATPFTIFIYVALINAYNMLDGLDGLALSQFLITLLSIGLFHLAFAHKSGFAPHAFSVFVAAIVILFANLGHLGSFLKCFLGDSGARFLGFVLVYVLIMEGNRILSPFGAAYFVALPLLDMCAVIAARVKAGNGPMMPDRQHLHHLMVDAGVPAHKVVAVMAAISISFIGFFVLLHALDVGDLALGAILTAAAVIYWLHRLKLVDLARRSLAPMTMPGPAE